jgi:hypothetical protein
VLGQRSFGGSIGAPNVTGVVCADFREGERHERGRHRISFVDRIVHRVGCRCGVSLEPASAMNATNAWWEGYSERR